MTYAGPKEARDAVYGFLTAGLASLLPSWTPVIVFDDKQEPQPPTDMSPYLRAQFRHVDRNQRTVGGAGGRRFRAKFVLTLKIYTRLGMGMDDYLVGVTSYPGADTIAGVLLHIFEGKTTGIDAAQFYHVRSREYGEDEGRYLTLVLVDGDYDTVR